jgi:hypothetical protein
VLEPPRNPGRFSASFSREFDDFPNGCSFPGPRLTLYNNRLAGIADVDKNFVEVRRLYEGEFGNAFSPEYILYAIHQVFPKSNVMRFSR